MGEHGHATVFDERAYWDAKRSGASYRLIVEREGAAIGAQAFLKRWLDAVEDPDKLALDSIQPGAVGALQRLSKGADLVVVTLRQSRAALEIQLDRLGLQSLFSAVLSASPLDGDNVTAKVELMRAHGLGPKPGWIVGDTEIDVRAGRVVGLKSCAVLCGIRDEPTLRRESPDLIVADLVEFASRPRQQPT
jgi:phosphoglycolate phosphatase